MRIVPMYSCDHLCDRSPTKGPGDPALRAARRCSLPDFDPAQWDRAAEIEAAETSERLAGDLVGAAAAQGVTLDFELDRDGCPEGWARCGLVADVWRYLDFRSRDATGYWVPALRLTERLRRSETIPERLLDLVEYAQASCDGALRLCEEVASRE